MSRSCQPPRRLGIVCTSDLPHHPSRRCHIMSKLSALILIFNMATAVSMLFVLTTAEGNYTRATRAPLTRTRVLRIERVAWVERCFLGARFGVAAGAIITVPAMLYTGWYLTAQSVVLAASCAAVIVSSHRVSAAQCAAYDARREEEYAAFAQTLEARESDPARVDVSALPLPRSDMRRLTERDGAPQEATDD